MDASNRNILRNTVNFRRKGGLIPALALAVAGWSSSAQVGSAEDAPAAPAAGKAANTAAAESADAKREESRRTLDDAIEYVRQSRSAVAQIPAYTAVFTKVELVEGKNLIEQMMEMKCRHQPFSIYFNFRSAKESGREVIYVEGANGGNLLVHERGLKSLAGTMNLRPDDPQVMSENRYPITDVGIAKIAEKSQTIWEAEKKADPGNVEVRFLSDKVGATECEVIEVTRKRQSPAFKYHLTRVYFDKQMKLPLRAQQYDWPSRPGAKPVLLEDYTYSDLKTNVRLTDADFDPKNPSYGF
jgi:hypothetical protein